MLAFLLQKYQVGGVRFLRESTPAGDQVVTKRGPTFLILIDVFHQPEDLLYLLDFVQRTRKEFIKEKSHPTGKLWIQFMDLIDLIRARQKGREIEKDNFL